MAAVTDASGKPEVILYSSFNQDFSCFSVGTTLGFYVYACDPFKPKFSRIFNGGVGIVEMLFKCNILALVGGGPNPIHPATKLIMWDDYQNKQIVELDFNGPVKGVKMRKDRVIVVLDNKGYVYNFGDLNLICRFETDNREGILAVSSNPAKAIVAAPSSVMGQVILLDVTNTPTQWTIDAHDNRIKSLALNPDASMLATASAKGTLVRIWDTSTAGQLMEFRRGSDPTDIFSLNFASTMLVVTSAKGTCHIFNLDNTENSANRQSSLSMFSSILPYFGSQWSFGQFPIDAARRCIACFGSDHNTIIVVSETGTFSKYIFKVLPDNTFVVEPPRTAELLRRR
ncbi:WD repeat domain phosphoinositide-interacting protein 3 [Pelomyxa schiedti]|nr:WD repeat domain phosphoinositide-interacting protein 3 [Pelomyxa schiedti]